MSCRYWSNAVEGEERKKPLDLLSPVVCISPLVATLPTGCLGGAPGSVGRACSLDAHYTVNSHVSCHRSSLRIFGLRSGCGAHNANSDRYNGPNGNPGS